ncbi:MAG: hypothetical protein HYU69_01215 [Bacteroidetes bacterium]|nr:hypothetical protein [Bacteroidota bacterium]
MKKFLIAFGAFVMFFISIGSMFKLMHWPGAGILLTFGMSLLSMIFLPFFFGQRIYENRSGLNIFVNIFGFLSISSLFTGVLFKVMHWPGGGLMIVMGSSLLVFPTLILYTIQQYQEYDRKFSEFWRMVFLTLFVSVFFFVYGLNYSKNILYTYLKIEDALLKTNENTKEINTLLLANIKLRTQGNAENYQHLRDASVAINVLSNQTIKNVEQLKNELIAHVSYQPVDGTSDHWNMTGLDNYDIPTHFLGQAESSNGRDLYESLNNYNQQIIAILTELKMEKAEQKLLSFNGLDLKIKDNMNIDESSTTTWHESMFYMTPLSGAVTLLTSIQSQVLNIETRALLIINNSIK